MGEFCPAIGAFCPAIGGWGGGFRPGIPKTAREISSAELYPTFYENSYLLVLISYMRVKNNIFFTALTILHQF